MSLTRIVTVHCDDCGRWHDSGSSAFAADEARRNAQRGGWTSTPRLDQCPSCRKHAEDFTNRQLGLGQ